MMKVKKMPESQNSFVMNIVLAAAQKEPKIQKTEVHNANKTLQESNDKYAKDTFHWDKCHFSSMSRISLKKHMTQIPKGIKKYNVKNIK